MTEPAENATITFSIKSSSDAKYELTLPNSTTVAELKTKLSSSEHADIPTDRIRLIYSGRVLKDPDTLGGMKIKDGHTVHLVKGAASNARQNPASGGSAAPTTGTPAATPQVPTNIAAGTGTNPLAGLTGARYAGFHGLPGADMFGPDGGIGGPNPDDMLRMMEDPNFLSQLNEQMNNPHIIQMMQDSPMLRNNPIARQMLENPEFRRMLMDPEVIRSQLQMQRAAGGGNAFPAPGVTDTTPQDQQNTGANATGTQGNQPSSTSPPPNPFAMNPNMFGGAGGQGGANPFAQLFGGAGGNPFGANPTASTPSTGGGGQQNQPSSNPLAAMMQQLAQMQNAQGGGQGGGFGDPGQLAQMLNMFGDGALRGGSGSPAPADDRPPEERYADQLRALNDMGFHDFDRNVNALRRSGGSVEGAVEQLLNG